MSGRFTSCHACGAWMVFSPHIQEGITPCRFAFSRAVPCTPENLHRSRAARGGSRRYKVEIQSSTSVGTKPAQIEPRSITPLRTCYAYTLHVDLSSLVWYSRGGPYHVSALRSDPFRLREHYCCTNAGDLIENHPPSQSYCYQRHVPEQRWHWLIRPTKLSHGLHVNLPPRLLCIAIQSDASGRTLHTCQPFGSVNITVARMPGTL